MRNHFLSSLLPIAAATAFANLAFPTAFAIDLQTTVSVEKDSNDSDPTYGLGMEYYFQPIAFGSGIPREELTFAQRVPTLTADASWQRQTTSMHDTSDTPPYRVEADIDLRATMNTFTAEYIYREPDFPHVLSIGGGLIDTKTKFNLEGTAYYNDTLFETFSDSGEEDVNGYAIQGGYDYYFSRLGTIGFAASYVSLDGSSDDSDISNVSIRAKRLWDLKNRQWIGLTAQLDEVWVDGDDSWGWTAQANFYFNERTGVYVKGSGKGSGDTTTFTAGLSHYFNDVMFARVFGATSDTDLDSGDDNSKTGWGITVGARF